MNAHAERFVRSIKSECLARVIPLGERHLRWLVSQYVAHYDALIKPGPELVGIGPITRKQRAGGLLSCYHREAA